MNGNVPQQWGHSLVQKLAAQKARSSVDLSGQGLVLVMELEKLWAKVYGI